VTQGDGDSRDLFVDDDPTTVIEVPDTLDRRIYVFLNRIYPIVNRDFVEHELRQLIAWAKEQP